jgi:O-antigen/teichoic acid export membrane protein
MNKDPAATRTRRFKLALLTSFAGKGVSTIVQLAALPLAIAALGQERFGVYAMLVAFLNWISIVSITITPGLTVQLVRANARADHEQERKVFGSALILSAVLASLLCLGTLLAFRAVGIEGMFGDSYSAFTDELQSGVTVLSIFIAMNVVLSVAEAAQAGYQNQYVHNVFLAIGNVFTIVIIALLVRAKPTIANMIVAVYAAPLVARAMSLIQLLSSRRYLIPGITRIDVPSLKLIAHTGSAFILTSMASFCYQSFSVYWVGRRMGPIAAAQMSVLTTILNVLGSLLIMITQPLWPAIQDATVRNDRAWVLRTYLRISKHLMIYVGIAALVIAAAGDHITHLWIRSTTPVSGVSQILLGFYFLLLAWEHLNYSFFIGLGRYWFASISYSAGAVIMLTNSTWLVTAYGLSGMLAAMCSGPFFVTAWIYPMRLRTLLASSLTKVASSHGENRSGK